LFVADAGAGIVRLAAQSRLIVELPGVNDVDRVSPDRMWAVTSGGRGNKKLYLVVRRAPHVVANLGRFERDVNPDRGQIDSNPFDVAALSRRRVLIADAGANALLIANRRGHVDWVATLPDQKVPTQHTKDLVGCPPPTDPPGFRDVCDLPPRMSAQAVPTSAAVGPDGAYYVTELTGFPAPINRSRIWRIDPGTRHVHCHAATPSPGCSIVADGFTSIVDLNFASDGTAYVVELDENSWFAGEAVKAQMAGGTIDECDTSVTPWNCSVRSGNRVQPMAVALDSSGNLFAVVRALKRTADVVEVP
jgi:hypothetical protein